MTDVKHTPKANEESILKSVADIAAGFLGGGLQSRSRNNEHREELAQKKESVFSLEKAIQKGTENKGVVAGVDATVAMIKLFDQIGGNVEAIRKLNPKTQEALGKMFEQLSTELNTSNGLSAGYHLQNLEKCAALLGKQLDSEPYKIAAKVVMKQVYADLQSAHEHTEGILAGNSAELAKFNLQTYLSIMDQGSLPTTRPFMQKMIERLRTEADKIIADSAKK